MTPKELLKYMDLPARFLSIDGSHEKDDVYLDLLLGEELLGPGGIVAVDDFLNPLTIGVNEAVNIYLTVPRRVVPFAYVANKLLLCHRSYVENYKAVIERSGVADTVDPRATTFREALKSDYMRSERVLFGQRILIIP
jgi:hypothetical protein